MSREVLQQALEALNKLTDVFLDTEGNHGDYEQKALNQGNKTILAIKAALAQPEFLSSNEADIAQLIEERDVREDILDKVLDMVLGIDRPEWSSSYQYIDAVEDVRAALAQQDAEAHLQAVSNFGQLQEPFGYFKPETFGWTDCAETDEGAMPLYEKPFGMRQPLTGTDRPVCLLCSGSGEGQFDGMTCRGCLGSGEV